MQGVIGDMMDDVNTGIAWVISRCAAYGGDPQRVFLVGQSCGAQLGTLALLTQVSLSCLPGIKTPELPVSQAAASLPQCVSLVGQSCGA